MNEVESQDKDSFVETLVNVNRVTKVVKGGRRFSFSACVVVGNKNGLVGYGHGKAKEVTEARTKASQSAKKNLIRVPIYKKRTIHHDVMGTSGAAKVIMRRCKEGTGIIAGGAMRCILDSAGISDVVAKSLGTSNVYTMIEATFEAFRNLSSPSQVAKRRGLDLKSLSSKKLKKPISKVKNGKEE